MKLSAPKGPAIFLKNVPFDKMGFNYSNKKLVNILLNINECTFVKTMVQLLFMSIHLQIHKMIMAVHC